MTPRSYGPRDRLAISTPIAAVVAVSIVVLAVIGLYVWDAYLKDDGENGPNDNGGDDLLVTIGGSTTVYEFSEVAVAQFLEQNPDHNVTIGKGGSNAGIIAVGVGAVDIGSSSCALDEEDFTTYPDLDKDGVKDPGLELQVFQVGWDAVVVVVPEANPHGLFSIDEDTLLDVYALNGGGWLSDGSPHAATSLVRHSSSPEAVEWNEVPRHATPLDVSADGGAGHVNYSKSETWVETLQPAPEAGDKVYVEEGGDVHWLTITWYDPINDVITVEGLPADAAADACMWLCCRDDGTTPVLTYDRQDASGTEENFCKKVLDLKEHGFEKVSELEEVNIRTTASITGNQDLAKTIAEEPDALGFMSFAIADAPDSGLAILGFAENEGSAGMVVPSEDTIRDGSYPGVRPLLYITAGQPEGAVASYLQFCLDRDVNKRVCQETDLVSLYE